MNDLIIRKAKIADAKDIVDINLQSWKKTYSGIFPTDFLDNLCKDSKDYEENIVKMEKKIQERKYIVAESNGSIVGFCNYGDSKKEQFPNLGEIYALYVRNDFIKKGVGKELFKFVVDELKNMYSSVIVSCLKENSSNAFYEKMGCKKIGESDFILNGSIYKENVYEI